jgi:hypothetical protein
VDWGGDRGVRTLQLLAVGDKLTPRVTLSPATPLPKMLQVGPSNSRHKPFCQLFLFIYCGGGACEKLQVLIRVVQKNMQNNKSLIFLDLSFALGSHIYKTNKNEILWNSEVI